jgi:cell fate regulator YaaT (PSP1 superfamily)
MPTVIPVKFQYAARDLWFDPAETGAQEADHVICATERGTEIGLATGDPREISEEALGETIGHAALKSVVRIATEADLNHAELLARKGEEALPVFRKLVEQSGLEMKPVGVEYVFGGEKVVCYFAAEERVDFRQLVRDLSRELHERIDMRQIGVREEAAVMGGYGHCGQELCCARFGLQFEPVSIRMAKEQDLPLNSSKISGACGRLMCCLRYEFEAYRDFKSRAPKRNAVIETPLGKAKIVEYDTPKEELCLRLESGKQVRVPLGEMVASDAAKKKSKDLGCACRPDTVLRSTLDRLSSPDVQMALAELDRQNGVIPAEPTFDDSDIFVDTKPARRRRKAGAADEGAKETSARGADRPQQRKRVDRKPADDAAADDSALAASTRTRRRHRKAGEGEVTTAPASTQRQRQDQGGQPGGQQSQPEKQHGMRKRRHHRTSEDVVQASQQRDQAKGGQQERRQGQGQPQGKAEKAPARHMRRPGDHGGQQPQVGQGGQNKGRQPQSQRPKGQAQQLQASAGQDGAPKTRRRHRGGRGRGGQGAGGDARKPGGE